MQDLFAVELLEHSNYNYDSVLLAKFKRKQLNYHHILTIE